MKKHKHVKTVLKDFLIKIAFFVSIAIVCTLIIATAYILFIGLWGATQPETRGVKYGLFEYETKTYNISTTDPTQNQFVIDFGYDAFKQQNYFGVNKLNKNDGKSYKKLFTNVTTLYDTLELNEIPHVVVKKLNGTVINSTKTIEIQLHVPENYIRNVINNDKNN